MRASSPAHYRTENSRSDLTRVELTWLEKRIEHWIRFGRTAEETIVNRRRRVVSFAPCRLRFRALGGQRLRDGRLEDRHRARGNGARIFRPCRSYVPAARFFCASMAGPRSTTFCGRSTPSKPAGSIQLTSRPTIGGTSTSAPPPASSRDRIRSRGTKRGSCAGARNDRPRPNPRDHAHRRLSDGLARARRSPAVADLERQRQRSDRALRDPYRRRSANWRSGGRQAARAPRELPHRPRLPAAWRAARETCGGAPGQSVCRNGLTVSVGSVTVGEARERDSRGRPLPFWQGCRVIAAGEVFLMNARSANSLDGRYFGPLPAASIIGRAASLWTIEPPKRSEHAVCAQFELGVFVRRATCPIPLSRQLSRC